MWLIGQAVIIQMLKCCGTPYVQYFTSRPWQTSVKMVLPKVYVLYSQNVSTIPLVGFIHSLDETTVVSETGFGSRKWTLAIDNKGDICQV